MNIKNAEATELERTLLNNPPQFPRTAPPYRIHWNWELSYRCNYRCSYCPYWEKGQSQKYPDVSIQRWREIWDRIFAKYWSCHIRFSGGEPTIYPGFFDLVAMLLEKNTVDITTNLSFDIDQFVKKVKPGAISVSASFHPEFNEIKAFLDKILFLHHKGYPSTVCYVAYPPHIEKIPYFKSIVEEKRIMFKIIPYQGQWQGKHYPRDYTLREKGLLEGFSTDSQDAHQNELNTRWYEWNVKRENKVKIEKKGKLCRMGHMYAIIHPDLTVTRCCARGDDNSFVGTMGSILDLDLRLFDEPQPCNADRCPCFKSMLVGYEEDKWLPLWESPEHPVYKTEYMKEFLEMDKQDKRNQGEPSSFDSVRDSAIEERREVARQSIPPSRVFYTWDIHYACNYRCSYCFFVKEWDIKARENRYQDIGRWKEIWDDIFQRYGTGHIHVSGGEPFAYPSFIDLVAHLAEKHTVEFDTNLSFDIPEFISKVKPGRVKFATAFHPQFTTLESYLPKVVTLKKEGFDIGVNYVAYPLQLDRMRRYKEAFDSEHISFDIMPFRGEYQERDYPKGYSEREKELIRTCDPRTAPRMLESYGCEKRLSRKGEICRMGQMYTKIHPNGDAFRCCYIDERGKLGNLIDGTFSLWDEPRPCVYEHCSCWTAMIAGKEKEWLSHWALPK